MVYTAPNTRQSDEISLSVESDRDIDRILPRRYSHGSSGWSLPGKTLNTPIAEQAVCFVLQNYATLDTIGSQSPFASLSSFDYLPDILYSNQNPDPLLQTVQCLGKLGIARHTNSRHLQEDAYAQYTVALQLTRQALRNRHEAESDRILVTVMLLGLYEVQSCVLQSELQQGLPNNVQWSKASFDSPDGSSLPSIELWSGHMNGIAGLIELRGKAQFRTKLGMRLFAQARAQVTIYCLQHRIPTPSIMAEPLPSLAVFDHEGERIINRLAVIFVRFCNSRATLLRSDTLLLDEPIESDDVIDEFLDIDAQLAAWAAACPQHLRPGITDCTPSETVYANYYHNYPNMYVATFWNHYLTIRIRVNTMLVPRLLRLSSTKSGKYGAILPPCLDTLSALAREICASVPFFFAPPLPYRSPYDTNIISKPETFVPHPTPLQSPEGSPTQQHSSPRFHQASPRPSFQSPPTPPNGPSSASANLLIWPLYAAGAIQGLHGNTPSAIRMKAWISGVLRRIAMEAKIPLAGMMAQRLETVEEGDWS
ncbi:MAG: hypothetical protein M1820_009268 [Bogoriella megaspora]|nr:MAG: hypothetical protein M1820_009268 [Bogoriella megaspora]